MQFLLKLFRALNSAQTPWQVTFAITLGMVAGLTPLSGIQTVVIFFLAFFLNIHLGLFFASSALFAGIGYLFFDPMFERLGAFNGEAANIADINTLSDGQSSALGDLGSNAGGLISGGGGIKKFLRF